MKGKQIQVTLALITQRRGRKRPLSDDFRDIKVEPLELEKTRQLGRGLGKPFSLTYLNFSTTLLILALRMIVRNNYGNYSHSYFTLSGILINQKLIYRINLLTSRPRY